MSGSQVEGDDEIDKDSTDKISPDKDPATFNVTEDTTDDNASVNVVSKPTPSSLHVSIFIESLVKNLCTVYEPNSEKVDVLYKLICDKLYKMNLIDESYMMAEFESLRLTFQDAFNQVLKNELEGDSSVALRPVWPNTDWFSSHYFQEFDELEYIAGGGFGKVFRVKHKLDDTEYAVKKIPIRAEGIKSVCSYLSEVKTFASINHSNIVQYKAAWLELGSPPSVATITDNETESLTEDLKSHLDEEYIYHVDESYSFSNNKVEDSSDFEVNFEHSVTTMTNCASGRQKREKRSSISEGGKSVWKHDVKEIEQLRTQRKANVKWATLYIQMALCQSTLKQWLESRNNSDENFNSVLVPVNVRNDTIYEVLRQLLRGLQYIHSKGIVHHDIKPSNIFVQLDNGNLLVQLGDFGLACPLQSARHSLAFGTKLYAAPEQLAGVCDPKSDLYSLGIVVFELLERFRTDMERVKYINDLRKGNLPAHLHVQDPQLGQIICQLVSKSARDRPNATALLKSITLNSDAYIEELESKLAAKDEEIMRLKELLKSAGVKT